MRLDEAMRRLERLPDPLPEPPAVLMPLILEGPERTRIRLSELGQVESHPAAVLVLLTADEGGEARIVLTERGTGGRHHRGEVSFPGGRVEPEDADPTATALREAAEEVGLDAVAAGVQILGLLEAVWIPVSGFRLTPVLAVATRRPSLVAAPAEVRRIVEAPLAAFLPDAPIEIVEARIGERLLRYGAYPIGDLLVWGATARVLGQLGAVLGRPIA